MNCPKCSTLITDPNQKFCIKCGNNIQGIFAAANAPKPAAPPAPVIPVCPKCSTPIENAAQKFCQECGGNIQGIFKPNAEVAQSPVPPETAEPVKDKVSTIFCRNCRKELVGLPEVCMNCGARPLAGKNYCNACGAQVSDIAIICVKCGTKFSA